MEFTKELKYNHQGIRYESSFSKRQRLIITGGMFIPVIAIVFLAVIIFSGGASAGGIAVFIPLSVVFLSVPVVGAIYLKMRKKFFRDVLIDDDNIYIRKGAGYFKFNRFELGTIVIRPGICERNAVCGIGDKSFEISSGKIAMYIGEKKLSLRVDNPDKLSYIMYNMAQNPKSGINWGTAYDSKNKNQAHKVQN